MGIYVGFDPGGIGAFGWAVLSGKAFPLQLVGCGTADHAQSAFEAARRCAGDKFNAVGIDAPLFWNPAGDRYADQIVRTAITKLGSRGGTVGSVNSLRGACLIQGILVAMMCQQMLDQGSHITEAHPKALLWLLGKATRTHRPDMIALNDLHDYFVMSGTQGANDHERDASLGAISAFAAQTRPSAWQDLFCLDPNPITPLDPSPGYWMPLSLEKPSK